MGSEKEFFASPLTQIKVRLSAECDTWGMNTPRPNDRRMARERRTMEIMIGIYCRKRHATAGPLCGGCQELLDYALDRLRRCAFGPDKPRCAKCPIHCYRPTMRMQIQTVMRQAGPAMLLKHPILVLFHLWDGRRKPSRNAARAENHQTKRSLSHGPAKDH
jgi:hypothetical protein